MSEFGTIIGLQNERLVTEVSDCSLEEIYRGIAALLHVWINKTFSGSFINYCVLIKLLRDSAGITGSRMTLIAIESYILQKQTLIKKHLRDYIN
jgi:phosphotransferase system  glucose/maltose/N-acetylglucosamine-specific IIC component